MEHEWKQEMSVNELTIDKQHKSVLDQINKITDILKLQDINMDLLRESIHFLHSYIKKHFVYEEVYMAKYSYPDTEKHKKIHKTFIQFYEDFQKELREKCKLKDFSQLDVKELLEKIQKYLADWWINHIMGEDHKYADYIKK